MDAEARNKSKKDLTRLLLLKGTVYVHLDPRKPNVQVPPWYLNQPQLVLQIGLNMPVPIPDLRVTTPGIEATLSFNRSPFFCAIPWDAVFAVVSEEGQGMLWRDDVPSEIALEIERAELEETLKNEIPQPATAGKPKSARASKTSKRPTLKLIRGNTAQNSVASSPDDEPTKPTKANRRRNHLKLVK